MQEIGREREKLFEIKKTSVREKMYGESERKREKGERERGREIKVRNAVTSICDRQIRNSGLNSVTEKKGCVRIVR